MKATLVVTHNCNFNCSYCLQTHENKAMSLDTAKKAIDMLAKIKHTKALQISFYGGEPLIEKDLIKEIVLYSEEQIMKPQNIKVIYEITTNGRLLDEDFIEFASKHRLLLALSHDGLAQDLTRRDVAGNLTREDADSKLSMLLSHNPRTPVMMTLHSDPESIATLSDSVRFFKESGLRILNVTPAVGNRVNWTDESFDLLQDQLTKVRDLYVDYNRGNSEFVFIPFENKIKDYVRQRPDESDMCRICSDKLMIDIDGRFYPCTHFVGNPDFEIGSLAQGPDESRIQALEQTRLTQPDCASCALASRCKHRCACNNHGRTGNISDPGAFQCNLEQLIIALADSAAEQLLNDENPKFVKRIYS